MTNSASQPHTPPDKTTSANMGTKISMSLNRRHFLGMLAGASALGALSACGLGRKNTAVQLIGPDLSGVDTSIPLVNDLYWHVNGTALDELTIPADKSQISTFSEISDRVQEILNAIITDIDISEVSKTSEDYQIRGLYDSFMDTDTIEKLKATPLAPFMSAISKVDSKDSLLEVMVGYSKQGLPTYFPWTADADAKNADKNAFYIHTPPLGLGNQSFYTDANYEEQRKAYVTLLETLAGLVGLPQQSAQETLELETAMASHTLTPEQARDSEAIYNKISWDTFVQDTPGFNWNLWRDSAIDNNAAIKDVIVDNVPNFKALAQLWEDTELSTLQNYIILNALVSSASMLSSEFSQASLDFAKVISGLEQYPDRWKRAIALIDGSLGFALGKKYVAAEFPESSQKYVQELVDYLVKAYHESIDNLEWMSSETKKAAQAKLNKISVKIGYPENWETYTDITISPDSLIQNLMSVSTHEYTKQLGKIGKNVDKQEWFMTPQAVNAYYMPTSNEIVFPAGIIQGVFFNPDATDATNFGGIGSVIGHEIGHAFDDEGSKFDGRGNLNNWWQESDREAYNVLVKKVTDQYQGLVPRGLADTNTVDGTLTVGENLADLGGLSVAIRALKIKEKKNSAPADASSDDIVKKQAGQSDYLKDLFLNWARIWRTKSREELAIQRLSTDYHAPGEFRANQTVKNIPDFYTTFTVLSTDEMYLAPNQRVVVW